MTTLNVTVGADSLNNGISAAEIVKHILIILKMGGGGTAGEALCEIPDDIKFVMNEV